MRTLLFGLPALLGIGMFGPMASQADTVYLATASTTAYRVTDDGNGNTTHETFAFPYTVGSMFVQEGGDVLAVANVDGTPSIVRVENPTSGTPSLTTLGSLQHRYASMTRIGDDVYGYTSVQFDGGRLVRLDLTDPTNPIETEIGLMDGAFNGFSGAGYDPLTDTLYATSHETDDLSTVDRLTGQTTRVGFLDHNARRTALEWYNGDLFLLTQNLNSGFLEIGTLNPSTVAYDPIFTLDATTSQQNSALAILPEPASLMMLAGLALLATRRRSI